MNKPKQRVCKGCGNAFVVGKSHKTGYHRSKIYCPMCVKDRVLFTKSMTLSDFISKESVLGKHPSWRFSHIRNLNRYWNDDLRKLPCASCGYSKHVELAHRKAIGSFPVTTTTLGEVNSKENNVQLCPNCHWEFDHGLLIV